MWHGGNWISMTCCSILTTVSLGVTEKTLPRKGLWKSQSDRNIYKTKICQRRENSVDSFWPSCVATYWAPQAQVVFFQVWLMFTFEFQQNVNRCVRTSWQGRMLCFKTKKKSFHQGFLFLHKYLVSRSLSVLFWLSFLGLWVRFTRLWKWNIKCKFSYFYF